MKSENRRVTAPEMYVCIGAVAGPLPYRHPTLVINGKNQLDPFFLILYYFDMNLSVLCVKNDVTEIRRCRRG